MGELSVPARDTSTTIAAIVSDLDPEVLPYRNQTSPDGMLTIVFTDIEGSTAMMERLGEEQWLEIVLAHNELVRGLVGDHGGDVIKSQGDGFMLTFNSAGAALACTVAMQNAVADFSAAHQDRSLRMRIGVHTGNIFRAEDDFFGRAVVLAARITGRARGGEVLVSAACKEYTERLRRWTFGPPTSLSLKGLAAAERVYSLEWQATGEG